MTIVSLAAAVAIAVTVVFASAMAGLLHLAWWGLRIMFGRCGWWPFRAGLGRPRTSGGGHNVGGGC